MIEDGYCSSCGIPLEDGERGQCWLCLPIPERELAECVEHDVQRYEREECYTVTINDREAEVVGRCSKCDLLVVVFWSHNGIFGHCTSVRRRSL